MPTMTGAFSADDERRFTDDRGQVSAVLKTAIRAFLAQATSNAELAITVDFANAPRPTSEFLVYRCV